MSVFDDNFKKAMAAAAAAGKRHPVIAPSGEVVGTSRNLAGIRRLVGRKPVARIEIGSKDFMVHGRKPTTRYYEGVLYVIFDDGTKYATDFADYTVLKDWVRRWRNVYGSPLVVEGVPSGEIYANNPALRVL